MKRISITILFVASVAFAFSQAASDQGLDNNRFFHNFGCMTNTVFSQVPVEYNVGFYCDAGYPFSKLSDNYLATGPFTAMRFWGVYNIHPTENFLIQFYDGPPGVSGTNLVHTFNVTTNSIPTPYLRNGQVIHQFDVDFATTINLLNGWVSVSRTTTPYVEPFAWICYEPGGNARQFNSTTWIQEDSIPFFCLGDLQVIPLADWAIYLGIGFILLFAIIRIRRII